MKNLRTTIGRKHSNPTNFANDPERARKMGRKGGKMRANPKRSQSSK